MHVRDFPQIVGWTTEELRSKMAQLVVAIRRDGDYIYTPAPVVMLKGNDVLIVIGDNL